MESMISTLALLSLIAAQVPDGGGWPFATGFPPQNFTSPAVGDVDGNGVLDLVFGSWDGYLYCVDAAGHLNWKVYLSEDPETPQLSSSPTLADADGIPSTLEVFVGSGVASLWGRLYVIGSNGAELARFDTRSEVNSSPLVVDADLDGTLEVYFGEIYSPYSFFALDVSSAAGSVVLQPRWSAYLLDGGSISAPAAADLVGDQRLEVVVAASGIPTSNVGGKLVYAFSADGARLWTFSTQRFNNFNSPTAVDLDADGRLEVLQASTDGKLYCLHGASGTFEWSFAVEEGSITHTQAVADLDQDGSLEIVVGGYGLGPDSLYCLDASGNLLWKHDFFDTDISYSSPSIGDLDRDGCYDIVIGTAHSNPAIHAFDCHGNLVWKAPQPGTVYSSAALADLDGDHMLEICFGVYASQYNVLTATGAQFDFAPKGPISRQPPWPMWHRTPQNQRRAR
jgi:outer membrane protein assembly factor BamB